MKTEVIDHNTLVVYIPVETLTICVCTYMTFMITVCAKHHAGL